MKFFAANPRARPKGKKKKKKKRKKKKKKKKKKNKKKKSTIIKFRSTKCGDITRLPYFGEVLVTPHAAAAQQ